MSGATTSLFMGVRSFHSSRRGHDHFTRRAALFSSSGSARNLPRRCTPLVLDATIFQEYLPLSVTSLTEAELGEATNKHDGQYADEHCADSYSQRLHGSPLGILLSMRHRSTGAGHVNCRLSGSKPEIPTPAPTSCMQICRTSNLKRHVHTTHWEHRGGL